MPSVYIETYGCQMNVADTELMRGHLARSGYTAAADPADADVILLNTCAIREHAEERIHGRLGALAQLQDATSARADRSGGLHGAALPRPAARSLAASGFRRRPRRLPPPAVAARPATRSSTCGSTARRPTPIWRRPVRGGVRAWITIMRGCDRFCTFCIVPYVRGRERSVPAGAVLEQVRDAVAQGYREVVFLGQTVNAYRDGETDFGDAAARRGRGRRRRPHPLHLAAPERHARLGDRCDGDLSRPSARNSICRCSRARPRCSRAWSAATRRRSTAAWSSVCAPRCRASRSRTDVIVGFPGESEDDFEATLALMRAVRFDTAFMFKYSRRDAHQGRQVGRDGCGGREGAAAAGGHRAAGAHQRRDQRRARRDGRSRCWSKDRHGGAPAGWPARPRTSRPPCFRTRERRPATLCACA